MVVGQQPAPARLYLVLAAPECNGSVQVDVLCRGILAGHRRLGQAQHARHLGQQRRRVHRLGGKTVHAGGLGVFAVLAEHAGGERNHRHRRQLAGGFPLPDATGSFQAVHAGHLNIHQHQVEGLAAVGGHGVGATSGGDHLVAVPRQHQLQQLQVFCHIVHRQDA